MTTVARRKLGLTHYDNRTAGGYTLFAPQTGGGRVPLIDDGGELVHEWNMPVRPGRDAVILPNNTLLPVWANELVAVFATKSFLSSELDTLSWV